MIEKRQSTYVITEYYQDGTGNPKKDVRVILEIDYTKKTYSIFPQRGSGTREFKFFNGNPVKWEAIVRCISRANHLGATETDQILTLEKQEPTKC